MTAPEDPHLPERAPLMWTQQRQFGEAASPRARLVERYRQGGASNVLVHGSRYARLVATATLHKMVPLNRSFQVGDKRYSYLFHPHNTTWRNERCVEIPLAAEVLRAWSGERILEIGNVLRHYMPIGHEVLDKYEHGEGVINEDVVEFTPSAPYDLIVSVSTLEHVGWDEFELEPDKVRSAVSHLTQILAPGGRLWITVPRGYHRYLDQYVDDGDIPFTDLVFLRRTSRHDWHQVRHEDVQGIPYGTGFEGAGFEGAVAIMIGIIDKPA